MKLIRLGLISILVLFALASLIGILIPSTVLVSRAVDITAPKDSIIGFVKDIQQWKTWMDGMESSSVHIHSATAADLAGTKVEISQITDSTVISKWISKKGNLQTATMRIIGVSAQQTTIVQWQFEQKLKWYPWEKLGSIMNDKIIGPMMEKNLNNLKLLIEKK